MVTREPPLSSNGENAKHPHLDCELNRDVVWNSARRRNREFRSDHQRGRTRRVATAENGSSGQ